MVALLLGLIPTAAAVEGAQPAEPISTEQIGEFGDFSLVVEDDSVTLKLDAPGYDRDRMRLALDETQNRNPLLSDTFREDFQEFSETDGTVGGSADWADFDGELSMTETGIAPGGGGWAAQGLLAQPQSAAVTQKTVFANMNCDKRADYVLRDPGDNNALYGWMNLGGFDNRWSAKRKIAYGVAMSFPVEVHLADLDGDGLDDYLVVDPTNGATRAWLNNGGN
ncbi:hypothetical protein [Streptomyces sp. NBC_01716]|uniref:hypothetical protein n=1 Tax=Streptomyces sp. NBC_01716 TaxID=2975917 RepID=UPI002E3746FE|nr:hypothetical protein [Streptomyces sp. NBC_01716]